MNDYMITWGRRSGGKTLRMEEIEMAKKALQSARYGIAWEGNPKEPVLKKMADGYWVPWHVADLLLAGLRDDARTLRPVGS